MFGLHPHVSEVLFDLYDVLSTVLSTCSFGVAHILQVFPETNEEGEMLYDVICMPPFVSICHNFGSGSYI